MIKVYWISGVMALPVAALASGPIVPTAPASYFAKYAVSITRDPSAKATEVGTFEIMELDGKLRLRVDPLASPPRIDSQSAAVCQAMDMFFDGKDTMIWRPDYNQLLYSDGLTGLPLGFIPPFNFHCHRYFDGININAKFREECAKASTPLPNATTYIAEARGTDTWMPSIVTTENGEVKSVMYGPSFAPIRKEGYAGSKTVGTLPLPTHIVITLYEQNQGEGNGSHAKLTEDLSLIAASSSVPHPEEMKREHYLAEGRLLSYSGKEGDAGIVYSPRAGTFDQQKQRALAHAKLRIRQTAGSNPVPSVPILLSGGFAVVAIGLSLSRRRK